MKIEREIEFKTELTKEQYNLLIQKFNQNNHIYKLTNYYFITNNNSFKKSGKTLRIRVKDDKTYTLTLKVKAKEGSTEHHIALKEIDALTMIKNGFNLKSFFLKDIDVYPYGKLTTYRARFPYKEGELFFDKFDYYGNIHYEVEYEAKDFNLGYKIFLDFLKSNKINYKPTMKKSKRVFKYLEEKRL